MHLGGALSPAAGALIPHVRNLRGSFKFVNEATESLVLNNARTGPPPSLCASLGLTAHNHGRGINHSLDSVASSDLIIDSPASPGSSI